MDTFFCEVCGLFIGGSQDHSECYKIKIEGLKGKAKKRPAQQKLTKRKAREGGDYFSKKYGGYAPTKT